MNPQLPARQEDSPAAVSRDGRIRLTLFGFYFALFLGFLLLNVFAPTVMSGNEIPVGKDRFVALGGTNLAVACGVGIILAGFFFSFLCMRAPRSAR